MRRSTSGCSRKLLPRPSSIGSDDDEFSDDSVLDISHGNCLGEDLALSADSYLNIRNIIKILLVRIKILLVPTSKYVPTIILVRFAGTRLLSLYNKQNESIFL